MATTLDEFERKGWLNDAAFARNWAAMRAKRGWGRRRIRAELRAKGVALTVVDASLPDEGEEAVRALEAAEKRWPRLKGLGEPAASRRLVQYLIRQGFANEAAWKALKRLRGPAGAFMMEDP